MSKSTIGVMSRINFRRMPEGDGVKLDFTAATNGIGSIHLYYAGKFVKTIRVNLTEDMEVKPHG
jgi:hypothetical protein